MKNLKKVLALVLVMATLMGLMVTASAATDFSDDADIDHEEAIDVMVATGIIGGYPDGSYRPDAPIKRGEMAKMITTILHGGEDVNDLYKDANVFADCYGHWASGYIAYASHVQLVSGVGDNMFIPNRDVKGTEAAKMLLVALGYDPTIETYTGATWAANVLADAKDAGLLEDLDDIDMNAPISRDDAAQLMFNALQASMVDYEDRGNEITINGMVIATGASKAAPVADAWNAVNTAINFEANVTVDGGTGAYMQLGEKAFDGDLTLNAVTHTDAFLRPARVWVYDGEDIGTYAETPDLVYTTAVDGNTLYKDLGKPKQTDLGTVNNFTTGSGATFNDSDSIIDFWVYTDGTAGSVIDLTNVKTGISDNVIPDSGAGVLTELYKLDSGDYYVISINTYIGEIDKFAEAKLDKDGDVAEEAYIEITTTGWSMTPGALADRGKFETDEFTEDDEGAYILYTAALDGGSYVVQDAYLPDTIEGQMDQFKSPDTVTVDGATYDVGANAERYFAGDTSRGSGAANADFDGTYVYYLDEYGNVMYVEVVEAGRGNYAYVVSAQAKGDDLYNDGSSVRAKIILTDGTEQTVGVRTWKTGGVEYVNMPTNLKNYVETMTVNATFYSVGGDVDDYSDYQYGEAKNVGHWYSYSVNDEGLYSFSEIDTDYAYEITLNGGNTVGLGSNVLTKDVAAGYQIIDGDADTRTVYMNSKTVVVSVDEDGEVSTFTGLPPQTSTLGLNSAMLVTYANDSNAITGMYVVDQASGLSTKDVTYAYALESRDRTSEGTKWLFAVEGDQVEYLVDDAIDQTVSAGGIYVLTMTGEKVTSIGSGDLTGGTDGTPVDGYIGGSAQYDMKDNGDETVIVLDTSITVGGAGSKQFTKADGYAVYNAFSSDKDDWGKEITRVDTDMTLTIIFNKSTKEAVVAYVTDDPS